MCCTWRKYRYTAIQVQKVTSWVSITDPHKNEAIFSKFLKSFFLQYWKVFFPMWRVSILCIFYSHTYWIIKTTQNIHHRSSWSDLSFLLCFGVLSTFQNHHLHLIQISNGSPAGDSSGWADSLKAWNTQEEKSEGVTFEACRLLMFVFVFPSFSLVLIHMSDALKCPPPSPPTPTPPHLHPLSPTSGPMALASVMEQRHVEEVKCRDEHWNLKKTQQQQQYINGGWWRLRSLEASPD